jgi:hypothetical protein
MVHTEAAANLTTVLKVMAQFELTVAYFYRTCAQMWFDLEEFWETMERAEIKHAGYLKQVNKILTEKPEGFSMGRPFTPAALKTSMSGIEWNIQRLRNGEITKKSILFISRDIERSILESNYGEIIKGTDVEFQALMKEILTDTVAHRTYLDRKIEEAMAGAGSPRIHKESLWSSKQPAF